MSFNKIRNHKIERKKINQKCKLNKIYKLNKINIINNGGRREEMDQVEVKHLEVAINTDVELLLPCE